MSSNAHAQDINSGLAVDIVFVGQVPINYPSGTATSTFSNHLSGVKAAPRGGGLFIRYSDGSIKNLTKAAGFGEEGFQGPHSIAVRDPCVHWNGQKILFSMVSGSPSEARVPHPFREYHWQLYEVTNLGQNETPTITQVPNQPSDFNNVMGIYASDERIIFISDRPRNAEPQLYPQLDEYISTPSNTGLWSLDPISGDLIKLDHAPSGDFNPTIDSFGRLLFTRWDHLQQDPLNYSRYNAFNYEDESASALALSSDEELFPEPRLPFRNKSHRIRQHQFSHFFPWQMNQDGSEMETLNHLGRHELSLEAESSLKDDPNIINYSEAAPGIKNRNPIGNLFFIKEDPLMPGRYIGIDSSAEQNHGSGQVVRLFAPPSLLAPDIKVEYLTRRETASVVPLGFATPVKDSNFYRDPLPLSTGVIIAAVNPHRNAEASETNGQIPTSDYAFRLRRLSPAGNFLEADSYVTSGIPVQVSYYDGPSLVQYTGPLWELQPAEIRAKTPPTHAAFNSVGEPERRILAEYGVDLSTLRAELSASNLALLVIRNASTRDKADRQQPFNLKIAESSEKTIGAPGKQYPVSGLQIFEGLLLRSYQNTSAIPEGRRVLAQLLKNSSDMDIENRGDLPGEFKLEADGSVVALVPTQRALSWQLLDPKGNPVVRERYWLTFQPGEVRVCTSCHGVNKRDQSGHTAPQNSPEALRKFLSHVQGSAYQAFVTSPNPNARYTARLGRISKRRRTTLRFTQNPPQTTQIETDFILRINGKNCDKPFAIANLDFKKSLGFRIAFPTLPPGVRASILFSQNDRTFAQARVNSVTNSQRKLALTKTKRFALCSTVKLLE